MEENQNGELQLTVDFPDVIRFRTTSGLHRSTAYLLFVMHKIATKAAFIVCVNQ